MTDPENSEQPGAKADNNSGLLSKRTYRRRADRTAESDEGRIVVRGGQREERGRAQDVMKRGLTVWALKKICNTES